MGTLQSIVNREVPAMIKVTILYPKASGSRFDFDYYLNTHMPMAVARLGHAMSAITVDRPFDPGAPWPPPPYYAVCNFICESREAFEAAFLPYMAELQGDRPNYTDVAQEVLITELALDYR
jgi:uncharacterized protein (TIGR02118 family)